MAILEAIMPSTSWVSDLIRQSNAVAQQREKEAAEEARHQQAAQQDALQSARRLAVAQQQQQYTRSRQEALDATAAAKDAWANAPFDPSSVGSSPSQALTGAVSPTLPAGGAAPSSGGSGTADLSVFGLVPDGNGGFTTNDPNDKTDQGVPGFDKNKGAWGANIKDPSLMGAAVSPEQLKAAGVNLDDPSSHVVRVQANGKSMDLPIVDKLGTPGRVDLTLGAYNALGGPQDKGGGLIKGAQYSIVPKGAAADAAPAAPTMSSQLAGGGDDNLSMAQRVAQGLKGFPNRLAMPAAVNAVVADAKAKSKAAAAPGATSLADQIKSEGLTYDEDTNRYTNADGAEFYASKTASGHLTLKQFQPKQVAEMLGQTWKTSDEAGAAAKKAEDETGNPTSFFQSPRTGLFMLKQYTPKQDTSAREAAKQQLGILKASISDNKALLSSLDKTLQGFESTGEKNPTRMFASTTGIFTAKDGKDRFGQPGVREEDSLEATPELKAAFGKYQSLVEQRRKVADELDTAREKRDAFSDIQDGGVKSDSFKKAITALDATAGGAADEKVSVIAPDGKRGKIPRSQLAQALGEGYKEAP